MRLTRRLEQLGQDVICSTNGGRYDPQVPICPDRIRSIPEQFSWVDHRLVRDRRIELLSHEVAALYLFLMTVADCQGLSYYADASLCECLAT